MGYRLVVEYDGFNPEKDNRILKLAGREDEGRGFGFGVRDISFEFKDRRAAYRRAEKIRRGLHRVSAYVIG